MKDCRADILGTEYSIYFVEKFPDRLKEHEDAASGLCNPFDQEIYIKKMNDSDCGEKGKERLLKNLVSHEIIHAFLAESGLAENTSGCYGAWSQNEEMVDWIAIQFPKILKTFQEVGCL